MIQVEQPRAPLRIRSRMEVARELLSPELRVTPWTPIVSAAFVALVVVFWITRNTCGTPSCLSVDDLVFAVRIGSLLLAIGAGFVLDDPTEDTTSHLPVQRWFRRGVRIALIAPPVLVVWEVLVQVALRESNGLRFPRGAAGLELAVMVIVALAASAVAARFVPERMGGVAAGPVMIILFVVALLVPARFSPLPGSPEAPLWAAAHRRMWWALAVGIVLLAVGSRDPFRRLVPRRGQLARRRT